MKRTFEKDLAAGGAIRVPVSALQFREQPGSAAAVESEAGAAPAKFSMRAHSGKKIIEHWYWGQLLIDLEGVRFANGKIPVLREHYRDAIVGVTTKQEVAKDKGIEVEGQFSKSTPVGQEVAALLGEGFPWQASIRAEPRRIERIERGASSVANGVTVKGPGAIFRETVVSEVSFCVFGADSQTDASPLSDSTHDSIELSLDDGGIVTMNENTTPDTPPAAAPDATPEPIKFASAAELKAAYPEFVTELKRDAKLTINLEAATADARKEAVLAERARVTGIQAAAFDGQKDLVAKLINDGVELAAAVVEMKDARLAVLNRAAQSPAGPGASTETEADPATLSDEEREASEWKKSAELRAEFSSAAIYSAYCKAKRAGAVL
jgi:hypothetical protein